MARFNSRPGHVIRATANLCISCNRLHCVCVCARAQYCLFGLPLQAVMFVVLKAELDTDAGRWLCAIRYLNGISLCSFMLFEQLRSQRASLCTQKPGDWNGLEECQYGMPLHAVATYIGFLGVFGQLSWAC